MHKGLIFLVLILVVPIFTGCGSMSPFNKSTITTNRLDNKELNYIQYYIDSPLTLENRESEESSKVDGNKVKRELTLFEKDIIILNKTPGVFHDLNMDQEIIYIKFAEDIILGFKLGEDDVSPSIFYSFNNEEVTENDRIDFRDKSWLLRFGARISQSNRIPKEEFRVGEIPKLVYVYTSKMKKNYESEIIEGIKVN